VEAFNVNKQLQDRAFTMAREGNSHELQKLLEEGVALNGENENQNTMLSLATSSGQGDVVQFLLSKGAEKSLHNRDGKTPLELAQEKGFKEIVTLLNIEVDSSGIPVEVHGLLEEASQLLSTYTRQKNADKNYVQEIEAFLQVTESFYKINPFRLAYEMTLEKLNQHKEMLRQSIKPVIPEELISIPEELSDLLTIHGR
jgi:ankyrin repeat protein